jgi:hypothetical protein
VDDRLPYVDPTGAAQAQTLNSTRLAVG